MKNEEIMSFLLKNDNLKDLRFENNFLRYNGKAINLRDFSIMNFFPNVYSKMYKEQKNISSEDFFNVVDLHTKRIERDVFNENEKSDIINLEHYFAIIGKENALSNEEQILVQKFHSYIAELFNYRDYLLPFQANFFNNYSNVITNLRVLEETNPLITLTKNQKYALDIYDQMMEILNKEKIIEEKPLTLNKTKNNLGYINNILIIFLTIISGFTLGAILFLAK